MAGQVEALRKAKKEAMKEVRMEATAQKAAATIIEGSTQASA